MKDRTASMSEIDLKSFLKLTRICLFWLILVGLHLANSFVIPVTWNLVCFFGSSLALRELDEDP